MSAERAPRGGGFVVAILLSACLYLIGYAISKAVGW